jgi:hypothetical protein
MYISASKFTTRNELHRYQVDIHSDYSDATGNE